MLLLSCGVIAASFLFDVRRDQRVILPWLPSWPLPSACFSKTQFHVDCPGCGLTRSFIHLAHGRLRESLESHRVGWLMALAVVLQIPYRTAALLGRRPDPLGKRFPALFGATLIVLLIVNWSINFCLGHQTP